ncbi:unnamed protein product, partial [Mesorhabditis belari]|uniref:Uncharacterized protein n=1 Tax=Mesorhabditis belari TaxID=2138241 RepID=A0AAF3FNT8_9BILA
MYGFANFIGVYVEQWIKNRTTAGNNAVPTMCEIGNAIKDYVSSHLNELIACVGQYNQATAGTVASDAAQIMLVMNNYNLDEIANGATCGAMSCLQAAYNNGLVPIYKAWISNKANYTTIQNQVCVLCVNYVSTATVGKCFENIKARTRVAVLTNLYDKYVPHYFGLYQHYRDVSTVACMTKSLQCGCNITVNATQANQAASAAASG